MKYVINASAVLGLLLSLVSGLGVYNNYAENHSEEKKKQDETTQALRNIGREETDLHIVYMRKFHLEVRWSNDKQGYYWFYDKYAKKVYLDETADDFYYQDGNARTYLKQLAK